MATAEELLAAAVAESSDSTDAVIEEILVADLNTRIIKIPATMQILGVEHDDDTNRLQFKIPRYYGEFDLSTFTIRINFENANGVGDIYPVDDVTIVDNDMIAFSWLVDSIAFQAVGDVKFSIAMKKYGSDGQVEKSLNTAIAKLPVLRGLETNVAVVAQNPSAFDSVMYRLFAVEAATGAGRDGYYSVVKVEQRDDGTVFTIVNQDGEAIAYVAHGRTPIKGEDYWTEEDKTEIESELKARVDSWAPIYRVETLAATAWVNNTQTITVNGVTKDNIIFPSPQPDDINYNAYIDSEIRCIAQDTDKLTFTCGSIPAINIVVNVAIYHGNTKFDVNNPTIIDDGEGNITIL